MVVLEFLRNISDELLNSSDTDKRGFFSDYIKDHIPDEIICTIRISPEKRLFIGKDSKKSIIVDFTTNPNTNIVINTEDLDQDDSYLVLKYGKILIEEIEEQS